MDEDTRKTIEHGQRIRAWLKQSEFDPVSVPEQIVILLALSAGLFDAVPIEQLMDAEQAVQKATASIPAEVCARFDSAETLSDEDRATIVQIARNVLACFQPKSESKAKSEPEANAEPKPKSKSQSESKSEAPTEVEPKPKPKPKEKS